MNQNSAANVRARTRILYQSRGQLTARMAVDGLKIRPEHTRRFAREEEPPPWTNGEPLMNLGRVVRHLNDTGRWVSGFAALNDAPGTDLSPEGFAADLCATRARPDITGLEVRLGTGQGPLTGRPASLEAWLAGDTGRARLLLQEETAAAAPALRRAGDRDRLTVVGLDLLHSTYTPYQQWMICERAARAEATDHDLRLLHRAKTSLLSLDRTRKVRDVLVLGRRVLYEIHHDRGRLARARRVDDVWLAQVVADQVLDMWTWADRPVHHRNRLRTDSAPAPVPAAAGGAP